MKERNLQSSVFYQDTTDLDLNSIIKFKMQSLPWLKDLSKDKISIKRLSGISNFNFLISSSIENKKYILRLPRRGTAAVKACLQRTYQDEYLNLQSASLLGIAEKLIFFDEMDGTFLFEYIEHIKPLNKNDFKDFNIMKSAVSTLKILHSSKNMFCNNLSPFLEIQLLYEFLNKNHKDSMITGITSIMYKLVEIEEIIKNLNIPFVPCHGDPNYGNFLLTDNGILLVDWEYSCNSDPARDLAHLSTFSDFDYEQDLAIKEIYDNFGDNTLFERLIIYKALIKLFEYLWFKFHGIYGDSMIDKPKYFTRSNRSFKCCLNLMKTELFTNSLQNISMVKNKVI